jgi:hypothetical protein
VIWLALLGLLLVFMVGPYSPIGELLAHLNLSATNTFLAVLDPPYFDSDGAVLADTPAGNDLGRPEQIPRL